MRYAIIVTLGVLVPSLLAGLAPAAERPAAQPVSQLEGPRPEDNPPPFEPATRPAPTTAANGPGPEALWDDVYARHQAYADTMGPAFTPDIPYHWHLLVEGGVFFLKPHLENNPAFTVAHTQTAGGVTTTSSAVAGMTLNEEFAPRVTAGTVNDCGFGLRTTWWAFDQSSEPLLTRDTDRTRSTLISSIPIPGLPGFTAPGPVARSFGVFNDTFDFASHLNLHVWDWDLFQEWHPDCWRILVGGGLRYAYLSERYQAVRANSGLGTSGTARVVIRTDEDLIGSGHNMSGAGPTAVLEVHRALLGDSGLGLYGTARGSVVFGRVHRQSFQATLENRVTIPVRGAATTVNTTTTFNSARGHDDDVPVGDLEFGVEYRRHCGPVVLFFQTGVVLEQWIDAGGPTSDTGDLNFFGLSLTAGVLF